MMTLYGFSVLKLDFTCSWNLTQVSVRYFVVQIFCSETSSISDKTFRKFGSNSGEDPGEFEGIFHVIKHF